MRRTLKRRKERFKDEQGLKRERGSVRRIRKGSSVIFAGFSSDSKTRRVQDEHEAFGPDGFTNYEDTFAMRNVERRIRKMEFCLPFLSD